MGYLQGLTIDGNASVVREYTAGAGISISNSGVISSTAAVTIDTALSETSTNPVQNKAIATAVKAKQDALTAGENVTISGNTISATDTKYTAGKGISISGNTISATADAITVDSALSSTSENPVQNKAIKGEIDAINANVSAAASAVSGLETRVQALEDGGECFDYSLDGTCTEGTLTLSLSDGTSSQSTSIPITAKSDFYAKEIGVPTGTYTLTPLTNDAAPVYIDFKISDEEGVNWKIVGLGKFELKDSSGNRVYGVNVAAFSMNTQKTLRTYWKVSGTSNKTVTQGSVVLLCARR